jgi:hypothetical protein
VDIAIDTAKEAVHELREKAQDIAGDTVRQVEKTWHKKRPQIHRYMDNHPWLVFGGLLLLAFIFSSDRRQETVSFKTNASRE